jgi:hypothetical protein
LLLRFLLAPYGYSLVVLRVGVLLLGGLLPLWLTDSLLRRAFRRLHQPEARTKRRAQLTIALVLAGFASYSYWFVHWLLY